MESTVYWMSLILVGLGILGIIFYFITVNLFSVKKGEVNKRARNGVIALVEAETIQEIDDIVLPKIRSINKVQFLLNMVYID